MDLSARLCYSYGETGAKMPGRTGYGAKRSPFTKDPAFRAGPGRDGIPGRPPAARRGGNDHAGQVPRPAYPLFYQQHQPQPAGIRGAPEPDGAGRYPGGYPDRRGRDGALPAAAPPRRPGVPAGGAGAAGELCRGRHPAGGGGPRPGGGGL